MTPLPGLADLIADVEAEAGDDDPLTRLAAAARARDDLDHLTESLLDHFVEEARNAGCSWSQIGGALGVTKQAAQQRHTTDESVARRLLGRLPQVQRPMFRRFGPAARAAVVEAQAAARRFQHDYIGTEHLLLGILAGTDDIGARALAEMGMTAEAAGDALEQMVGQGPEPVTGHIVFTPRSKKVLELSLRHAIRLGHPTIGTEHVLLALLSAKEGIAAHILESHGIDKARAEETVLRLLGEVG